MTSKAERVIQAVETLLNGITAVTKTVDRGGERPTDLTKQVHYMLLDGDPGEVDGPMLGDQGPYYFSHTIELQIFVQTGAEAERHSVFDAALTAVETGFEAAPTLGGLIKGFDFRRPEAIEDADAGSAGIKAAALEITVEYQSDTRL